MPTPVTRPVAAGEPLELPAGTRIGDYEVLGKLGRGGMGVVLLAQDLQLGREVAIKLIHPALTANDGAYRRFVREARTLARIGHPNVVRVYTWGRYDQYPYFVMELIEGEDAAAWIAHYGRHGLPVDRAVAIVDQASLGLHAIHEAGAVHGDVKPANLLIGPAFRVVVADLGLARPWRTSGGTTTDLSGTPAYMAPEKITQLPIPSRLVPRADVYALACTAFEILTGRAPFEAETPSAFLSQHALDPPPRPSEVRADLSRAFDAPILRALEKDPAKRPTVIEFREELTAAAAAGARFGRLRILALDDDRHFLAQLRAHVTAEVPDAELVTCQDGEEAIRRAAMERFDLCLLDLEMPGKSGREVAEVLLGGRDPTPVLVITGRGSAEDWRLLERLGVSGFVLKPLDPFSLGMHLRRLVPHGDV